MPPKNPVVNRMSSALPANEALPPFLRVEDVEGQELTCTAVRFEQRQIGETIVMTIINEEMEETQELSFSGKYVIAQAHAFVDGGGQFPCQIKFIKRGRAWILD